MKLFQPLLESKDSYTLLKQEITQYIKNVKKKVSPEVLRIIQLTEEMNILTSRQIEDIINTSKSDIGTLAQKMGIEDPIKLYDLWALLKSFKDKPTKLKQLPQFQSKSEREAIEQGRLSVEDATLDLKTQSGKNAAAKIYMPVVLKLVNDFVGKSKLTRNEIMSAALMGMTKAMEIYDPSKGQTFKQVLAYQVRFAILDDMNKFGHSFSGTHQHSQKVLDREGKGGTLDAASLDGLTHGMDDDFKQDYIATLASTEGDDWELEKQKIIDDGLKSLYKLIDQAFSERDATIIYKWFGINGYEQMNGAQIAKQYGISSSLIHNKLLKKLFDKISKVRGSQEVLLALRDAYMENALLPILHWTDKKMIVEKLDNNKFIDFLYESTNFFDKNLFKRAHKQAIGVLKDRHIIEELLEGEFDLADKYVKTYRDSIILYIEGLYQSINQQPSIDGKVSDIELIEEIQKFQNLYKKSYLDSNNNSEEE